MPPLDPAFPDDWFLDMTMFGSVDESPLHLAAKTGDLDSLSACLREGANLNATVGIEDYTALYLAVEAGKLEGVRMLVNAGAEVDARSGYDGQTPLCLAVEAGALDIVRVLLEAGADPTAAGHEFLGSKTPLGVAIREDQDGVMQAFIETGLDVNAEVVRRAAPLAQAARMNRRAVGLLLLRHGVTQEGIEGADSLSRIRVWEEELREQSEVAEAFAVIIALWA